MYNNIRIMNEYLEFSNKGYLKKSLLLQKAQLSLL